MACCMYKMILIYSSFLMGIVHIYGLYISHWMGPAYFVMTTLSITNYSYLYRYNIKEFTRLRQVDYVYAHLLLVGTMWEALRYPLCLPIYIYWTCVIWITYVYKIMKLSQCPKNGDYWHSTIHASATIGSCALLYAIQSRSV